MTDLLIRLYDLPYSPSHERLDAAGIVVRRALPPEQQLVLRWIGQQFSHHWVSEAALGMNQQPPTVFLALRGQTLLGFACFDTTAKGYFGPTGVDAGARGQGIGEALLFKTLSAMRGAGYAYAVIGDPGPVEFYRKRLDALPIPGSTPGLYRGLLKDYELPS